jgi:DNA-binding transcriptional ArsR family regulator
MPPLAVPHAIRDCPQWVCWRWDERAGKRSKVPISPKTGKRASSTDQDDWASYDETVAYARAHSDVDGIGFVFAEDDPFCGVDLDDCRDAATGDIAPWARAIVDDLDSYAEVSPSGTGVKVFLQGVVPGDRNRTGSIEMYDQGRFFTFTGDRLPDAPTSINARQKQLTRLYRDTFGADEPTAVADLPPSAGLSDDDVINAALDVEGTNFARLYYKGDVSGYQDGDDSAADWALASMLVKQAGGDVDQVERLMRASALNRHKWAERRGDTTYLRQTITKALKASLASPSLIRKGRSGHLKNDLQATSFSRMGRPGPTLWVVKNLIPERHPSTLFGAGGEGKSFLAMDLGIAVADPGTTLWLGLEVQTAPVVYLDFELDYEVQARRAYDLAAGRGLSAPPDDLHYIPALGVQTATAFRKAADVVRQTGAKLVILDSIGPAMQGDAEASKDVLAFFRDHVEALRETGAAVLIVDHQAKLVKGERTKDKLPFGSVYKTNLSRSVIQVRGDWSGAVLTATLYHAKANFGPKLDPITARLTFDQDSIRVEHLETPVEVVVADAPTAKDKVLAALQDGPAYPDELAAAIGLEIKTVKNALTELRKAGAVVNTGEKQGQSRQVSLASLPYKGRGRSGHLEALTDTTPENPDDIFDAA